MRSPFLGPAKAADGAGDVQVGRPGDLDVAYVALHHDHFLLLNIAVGGTWAGRPDETTDFPQDMRVDWVRVYQKDA